MPLSIWRNDQRDWRYTTVQFAEMKRELSSTDLIPEREVHEAHSTSKIDNQKERCEKASGSRESETSVHLHPETIFSLD